MSNGYSANPLFRKLGLREGFQIKLIHPPEDYSLLIGQIYDKLMVNDLAVSGLDFIHFFPKSKTELEQLLPRLKKEIKKDGVIWVSWYKISSRKKTELSEDFIRETALANGMVDVKVCSVDADWSALKLVFRLRDR